MWRNKIIKCKTFYHFAIGRELKTLLSKITVLTILVDKVKCGVGVYFSRICEDNFKSNLVHVVDLDLGVVDHSDGQFQVKSSAFRTPGSILYHLNTTKYFSQASFHWCI